MKTRSRSSVSSDIACRPGRPRSADADRTILKAALEEALSVGFRALTIDQVSARSGVAKTTIYRRWPNKAAVVMDAFLRHVGSATEFSVEGRALDSMRRQLHAQARAFRGRYGRLVRELIAEAQFDTELAQAFLERWRTPRREAARRMVARAILEGDLRPGINIDTAIDLLYAPLYYRLQIASGPLSDAYVDSVFNQVVDGLRRC